jgi:hypothetical protein
LEGIWDSGFRESELQSIVIPSSVFVLGKHRLCLCKSLESVTFESGSGLERIKESAFEWEGWLRIEQLGNGEHRHVELRLGSKDDQPKFWEAVEACRMVCLLSSPQLGFFQHLLLRNPQM